jgi:hypothetical protein
VPERKVELSLPGAATHVFNVHMIGKNLANTTASLEDKNIRFCLKLEKNNVLNKKTYINQEKHV